MALGEQDGQREADGVGLALDDGLHRIADAVRHPYQLVKGSAGCLSRYQEPLVLLPRLLILSAGLLAHRLPAVPD